MSLRTATSLAIGGASVAIALMVIDLIACHVSAVETIAYAGNSVIFSVLWIAVYTTFLLFFITLRRKQK